MPWSFRRERRDLSLSPFPELASGNGCPMKDKDIEVGKEYGIRTPQGIDPAGIIRVDGWWVKLDRTVDYRREAPITSVIGLWADHPEWQEALEGREESEALVSRFRALIPQVLTAHRRGSVQLTLTNADAKHLIAALEQAICCPICKGTGKVEYSRDGLCGRCDGSGRRPRSVDYGDNYPPTEVAE